jgi:capsular exopolysaccharide synthesis family protein
MTRKELMQYLLPLRRWWWLIVGAAAVAAVSSFLYLRSQPVLYESRTTVMVGSPIQDPNPSNNQFYLTQVLARIYADLANRSSVRASTMKALGMDWLPAYTASALPDSQVIEIAVTDVDPARAQAVAAELVNQLVGLSPAGQEEQERRNFVKQQLSNLEKNITDTEDERVRIQAELGRALSARDIRSIQDQITALDSKLNVLQSNYAALIANSGGAALNAIHVLEPASLPATPVGTRMLFTVALAAMLGAALAVAGAYALEFMDDGVAKVMQVEKLGLVPLGSVPTVTGADDEAERLVMLNDRYSAAAEAYRVLRTNLQFASVDRPLGLVQVSSPNVGEGKSMTAANLAIAIAQLGQQVILVDADLHQPTQHRYFQVINNVGVTTALLGNLELIDKMLKPTATPNLQLLTSGPLPPNPAELLGSKRMQELLAKLKTKADIVVIDSPPITVISDAVVLATHVDGVLLVLRSRKTRLEQARNALNALAQVHANVLGAVLNGTPAQGHGYYYRYRTDYGVQNKHSETMRAQGTTLQQGPTQVPRPPGAD